MIERTLPNLVIVGANRAGSTSLFSYLSLHPSICGSSIKETCYFLPIRYGATDLSPIEEYLLFFNHCGAQPYRMEASTGYFYGGAQMAQRIYDTLGDSRIIIILREPVKRALSYFKFYKSRLELRQELTFAEYVRQCENLRDVELLKPENSMYWGIRGGLYSEFFPPWLDVFGDNLKVLFLEHLEADLSGFLISLCEWLQLDPSVYRSTNFEIENKGVNYHNAFLQKVALWVNDGAEGFWRAHPRLKQRVRRLYYAVNGRAFEDVIPPDVRSRLESIFGPYNRKLADQLHVAGYSDLPDWVTQWQKTSKTDSVVRSR